MSDNSEYSCVNTFGIRGIPAKCVCGLEATIYMSKTKTNPGRPFFRCPTKRNDHLFKWVETAVFEEVDDALPKFGFIESELYNGKDEVEAMKDVIEELKVEVMRTESELYNGKAEVKAMKAVIEELKAEVMLTKMEVRRCKVFMIIGAVVFIGVVVSRL